MDSAELFIRLGIALGLGLLVGLQRESVDEQSAGIRTFALIALTGAVSSLVAVHLGVWVLAAGFVALGGMVAVGYVMNVQRGKEGTGVTTEIAALLIFVLAAYVMQGDRTVAVVVGGTTAALLHFKGEIHGLVDRFGDRDLKATMQFVVICMVILPILPDETYGPYEVLNPRGIWLMVVLVVGLGLAAYVAYKMVGERAGTILGGLLGGLISSTATTVSYARRGKGLTDGAKLVALAIHIASTVAFIRVLVEVAVVAPRQFNHIWPPLAAVFAVMVGIAIAMWWFSGGGKEEAPEQVNPAELKPALIFAFVYAIVIFAVAWAKEQFGQSGLYAVAVISGLADVDAMVLSAARLVKLDRITTRTAWQLILIAAMMNLVFKGALVGILGNRRLAARVGIAFAITWVAGGAVLLFWP